MNKPTAKNNKSKTLTKQAATKSEKISKGGTTRTRVAKPQVKRAPSKPKQQPAKAVTGTPNEASGSSSNKQSEVSKTETSNELDTPFDESLEKQLIDEWNSMDVDAMVDDIYVDPAQSSHPSGQQSQRDELIGEIIEDIRQEETPLEEDDVRQNPTPSSENNNSPFEATPHKQNKLTKPLGLSLLGKTWRIKGMFALIILVMFLLVNYVVFNKPNLLQGLNQLLGLPSHNHDLATAGGNDLLEFDVRPQNENGPKRPYKNIVATEDKRDATLMTGSVINNERAHTKPITEQELQFWQQLAKTSFEEIANRHDNGVNHEAILPLGESILSAKVNPPLENTNNQRTPELENGKVSVLADLEAPEDKIGLSKAQVETIMSTSKTALTEDTTNKSETNDPWVIAIGMEEKTSLPNISTTDERLKIATMLLALGKEIRGLHDTTQSILAMLQSSTPTSDTLATASIQDLPSPPVDMDHGSGLGTHLSEKFRINFPGLELSEPDKVSENTDLDTGEKILAKVVPASSGNMPVSTEMMNTNDLDDHPFPLIRNELDGQLIIRSLTREETGFNTLKNVSIGDEIPGFGLVLNIKEDDAGRMIVMENGIVYLNLVLMK